MPYRNNSELPDNIKSILPQKAQDVFRNVVNDVLARGGSEKSAMQQAWGALKNQGWSKGEDGRWHKVEKIESVTMSAKIEKYVEDQNLVFGWFSIVEKNGEPVVDHQGDVIEEAELEKAMYDFVENYRSAGEMHERTDAGRLVEMMVFTKQKQKLLGIDLGMVGAWGGFRLDDKTFAKVKDGTYTMFSIGGSAIREEINDE